MSLEVFTGWIKDLVQSNPANTDDISQGDDHLRGIKKTLLDQFSGFTQGKPITINEDSVNSIPTLTATAAAAVKRAGDTMTGPLVLFADASGNLQAVPLQQAQAVANAAANAMGALKFDKTGGAISGSVSVAGDLVATNALFVGQELGWLVGAPGVLHVYLSGAIVFTFQAGFIDSKLPIDIPSTLMPSYTVGGSKVPNMQWVQDAIAWNGGRSYLDVTGQRGKNTPYTNDTGRDIYLDIDLIVNSGTAALFKSGVKALSVGSGSQSLSTIVIPGQVYALTNFDGDIASWRETRK